MEGLTGAEPSYESVVVDGNVTTSRGLGTAVDFALSLIGQRLGEEKADEIAESVVYSRKLGKNRSFLQKILAFLYLVCYTTIMTVIVSLNEKIQGLDYRKQAQG